MPSPPIVGASRLEVSLPVHAPSSLTLHAPPGLKLLSFDGGGIRGLSSLLILKEIMNRVKVEGNLSEPPLPWQYFDMITGTSTGGLIALMLGRLRMSIDQAIQRYAELAKSCFSETKYWWQDGTFKASRLEEVIKKVILEHTERTPKTYDTEMLDERLDACKVFVCTMQARNMNALIPVRLRTYKVYQNASPNCMIWQAARATSAAPTFFKRVVIKGDSGLPIEYIDAGIGCNNPTAQIIAEVHHVFPGRHISTLVSIGTGQAETIALPRPGTGQNLLPSDVVKMLQAIATDCEKTAQDMSSRFGDHPDVYFRFNVDQGMQEVGLGDWESLSNVEVDTDAYLRQSTTTQSVGRAARSLVERRPTVEIGLVI